MDGLRNPVIVRCETNGWKWPVFQWLYMGALVWMLAFITGQGGQPPGWTEFAR